MRIEFNVKTVTVGAALAAAVLLPLWAQAPASADIQSRLRLEETNNSKAMWIMHEITDLYAPRMTGSPKLKAADDWAVATMTSWGLKNAHLEPWTFSTAASNHQPIPGWENMDVTANALEPFRMPLEVRVQGWTPSTQGVITTTAVLLTPPGLTATPAAGRGGRAGTGPTPEQLAAIAQAGTSPPPMPPPAALPGPPTPAELDAYLNGMKDKIHGHIVLLGQPIEVPENFVPAPLRTPDEVWAARYGPTAAPAAARGGAGAGRGPADPAHLTPAQVQARTLQFLVDNGAAVKVTDAGEAYGVIRMQANYSPLPQVPSVMMRNEDYGRIARLLQDGTPVTLRINIVNKFYPEGSTVYNAIGEIPGTDKADEVVMMGGHYDCWNGGTGATDNGAGSTIMLEAIRLLQSLNVKPRRTIRVALWSGEEEGLLGSLAYVDQHFGSAENPKPEFAKLDAYINIDGGTGKPRGAGAFGPAPAGAFIADTLAGFKDWGFNGANTTTSRATGGTDSTSFNHAGLPGIGLNQDGFDYGTFTHHTNDDTYERIYEPDIREAAVEAASLAYALAMAPDMLPRFSKADMPPLNPPPAAGRGGRP